MTERGLGVTAGPQPSLFTLGIFMAHKHASDPDDVLKAAQRFKLILNLFTIVLFMATLFLIATILYRAGH